MKKTLLLLVTLISVFSITKSQAQEAPRYKMEMTIEANGRSSKADISSVNYSISRNVYDTATEVKKEKGKAKEVYPYTQPNDFYITITLNKIDKELLTIVADKKSSFGGVITITDTYGKEAARKIAFKNGFVSSLTESLSGYSASYGSAGSMYISVKELVIDEVKILP